MKQADQKEPWLKAALSDLEQEAHNLDAETQSRLTQARARALETPNVPFWRQPQWQVGFAVACLMALIAPQVLSPSNPQQPTNNLAPTPMAMKDMPIIVAEEGLDFYQNMEFILWLEAQQTSSQSG